MSRAIETLVLCIVAASVSYEPPTATPAVQVAPAVKTTAYPPTVQDAGEVAGILETPPETKPGVTRREAWPTSDSLDDGNQGLAKHVLNYTQPAAACNSCQPATVARGYQRQTYRSGPVRRLLGGDK